MPSLDVLRAALIVLLLAALVGVGYWFVTDVAPGVISTGASASAELVEHGAGPWGLVVALFGPGWAMAWAYALALVLLLGSVFLVVRVLRWLQ